MGQIATFSYGASDLVVDRAGTATVTYLDPQEVSRTADDPPAPGDPQNPAGAGPYAFADQGDTFALDAEGNQTFAYLDFKYYSFDDASDIVDIVLIDRPPGGTWSTQPTRLEERVVSHIDLAVNASGAAVVVWSGRFGTNGARVHAMYRPSVDAAWSKPQRLPRRRLVNYSVSIDDAGRVLLVYEVPFGDNTGIRSIRRTPAGRWSRTHILDRGPDVPFATGHGLFRVAHSAGGSAVAVHGPLDGDYAATRDINATRMRANGTWQPTQPQPQRLGYDGLAIDRHGRALLASWGNHTLRGRWSRPDGTWSEPFTIATDVVTNHTRLFPRIAMNRRGDALATWATRTSADTFVAWGRYKPAGGEWTRPTRLTGSSDRPLALIAAIGDCGHAAVAWTAAQSRALHIRRATPNR